MKIQIKSFAIACLLALSLLPVSLQAAETNPVKSPAESLYATGFGAETLVGVTTGDLKDYTGLYGVGVSYFYHPNFGLRARVLHSGWEIGHGSVIQDISARFEGRLPVGSGKLAPYGYVGAGYRVGSASLAKGRANLHIDAGAGLEYRFSQRIGVFAEAGLGANLDRANAYTFAGGLRFGF